MTPAQKAELASVLAGIEEMKIRPNSTCIPFFLAWACYQIKFQIFVSQRGRITCATRPSQAPCFNRGFQAWNVPWRMLLGLHASGVDWKAVACFTVLCHYRNPALWDVKYSCNFMHAYIYILLLLSLLLLYIYIYIVYTHWCGCLQKVIAQWVHQALLFFWCLGSSMQYWRCCPQTFCLACPAREPKPGTRDFPTAWDFPTNLLLTHFVAILCNTLHSGALMTLVFKPFNSIKSKSDFCPIAVGDLAWMLWSQHLQKWPLAHCHVRFWMRPPTRRGFVSYAKYTHGLRGFLLASIPLSSPVYIWPTFPRWRSLQLASHLPCTMTCAQRRGTTWKGGGKQREAKQPNALRRSSVPPSAPRVWRMLPHPRPDQRQQMIAPFQAANASWRPFAKWEPNQALFLEPASHSFSARLFVITPFWWCRIPTSDSLRFTCFISYMTFAYICHKLGYSTLE